MPVDYVTFITDMQKVYDKFPGGLQELRQLGTEPEAMIGRREGGPAIVFRHPQAIAGKLGDWSNAIAGVVPAMAYPRENVQTTVNAFTLRDRYVLDRSNAADEAEIMQAICAVAKALRMVGVATIRGMQITYRSPLFSRGVVLVPGYPNEATHAVREAILASCGFEGVTAKAPWGAQCVIARFLEPRTPAELAGFYPLVDSLANEVVGISRPEAVEVIANVMGDDGQFQCITLARFDLATY